MPPVRATSLSGFVKDRKECTGGDGRTLVYLTTSLWWVVQLVQGPSCDLRWYYCSTIIILYICVMAFSGDFPEIAVMQAWKNVGEAIAYFKADATDVAAVLDVLGGTMEDGIPILASLPEDDIRAAVKEWSETKTPKPMKLNRVIFVLNAMRVATGRSIFGSLSEASDFRSSGLNGPSAGRATGRQEGEADHRD